MNLCPNPLPLKGEGASLSHGLPEVSGQRGKGESFMSPRPRNARACWHTPDEDAPGYPLPKALHFDGG